MKDLTKIYIDLSKCTEEEQKHIFSLLPAQTEIAQYVVIGPFTNLHFKDKIWVTDTNTDDKQELTYPEFIKFFEDGEEKKINMTFGITDKHMEIINKQISRFEGAEFDRLSWEKIAKEIGWDLPTVILWYFRKKESQNNWIKIESEADLPPYNKWVIAYTKDGGNHIAYFDKKRNEWVANSKFGDEITHWRHEPEPPKF